MVKCTSGSPACAHGISASTPNSKSYSVLARLKTRGAVGGKYNGSHRCHRHGTCLATRHRRRARLEASSRRRFRAEGAGGGYRRRTLGQGRRYRSRHRWGCESRLRSRPLHHAQGPEEDGPLHPLRHGGDGASGKTGWLDADRRRRARAHGNDHRVGRRRLSGDRRSGADRRNAWRAATVAFHRAVLPRQPCRRRSASATASRGRWVLR